MQIYKFGNIYLNTQKRQIKKDGESVLLTPKTFDVLQMLVENHGKIVSKDELLGKIWRGSFVEETNLAVHISKIRKIFDSNKTNPLIETVPGSGYRFVADVEPAARNDWENCSGSEDTTFKKTIFDQSFTDSIAVLPLHNEMDDEDIEYLADGLTESFINSLANLPSLKVIARNSVFRYKNKDVVDFKEISHVLGVSKILTGRIKIIKDHILISVELINAEDNSQLWGFQYNQPFSDIIKIQEEITTAVSDKLKLGISQVIETSVSNPVTENTESYRLYLKGKYFIQKPTEQFIYKAIECFEKSISYDPLNVLSYVEIAECFRMLYVYDYILYEDALKKINPILSIISKFDQSIAEIQVILGAVKETLEWKFEEAEKYYQHALSLNPNCIAARYRYLILLTNFCSFSEALKQANQIVSLDPLSTSSYRHIGRIFYRMEQFTNSIAYLEELLELEPNDYISLAILGACFTELGDFENAIKVIEKSLNIQFNLEVLSLMGYTHAIANNHLKAKQIIKQIKSQFKDKHHISSKLAKIYIGLGDIDTAFDLLEKALEEHDIDIVAIKNDPRMKKLKINPKFDDLVRKIGLPSN